MASGSKKSGPYKIVASRAILLSSVTAVSIEEASMSMVSCCSATYEMTSNANNPAAGNIAPPVKPVK